MIAAGLVLLVAVGAVALMLSRSPFRAQATSPISVSQTGDANSLIEAHNSPSLVVDPNDDAHLVEAERVDRPRFDCRVHVSRDRGASWVRARVPLPEGRDNCFIPDLVFSRGSVFLVFLTLNTHPRDPLSGGNDPNGMYLERSDDGGMNFGQPIALPGTDNLQPRLAADPRSGDLYIVYLKGSPLQNDTPLGLGPPPNPIVVISSRDGGATFSEPVPLSDSRRPRVGAPSPAVLPNGDLIVLYEDYKGDLDDYSNAAVPYRGTFALMLARSADGGRTFSNSILDDRQVRPSRFLIYLPPFPSLAVSPDGSHLYAAWSDSRDGAPDILLRRSEDGGRRWSGIQKLNRRPGGPANYLLPALAASSRNRVEAIWYAVVGNHPSEHVEYSYSADGGRTFAAPITISSAFDPTVGPPSARLLGTVDFGCRLALAATASGGTVAAWSDSSRGSAATGRTDIMTSRVELQ